MSFAKLTVDVASTFLQTVVVFDDEACFSLPGTEEVVTAGLQVPTDRETYTPEPVAGESEDTPSSVSEPNEDVAAQAVLPDTARPAAKFHQLDAKLLMDGFADKGMVCAVIKPAQSENLISSVIRSARNADVMILDWAISKDNGDAALAVVQEVLKNDGARGRLRLFVIYTGEPQLRSCFDKAKDVLSNLAEDPVRFLLHGSGVRIVFLQKDSAGAGADIVPVQDLPAKVIELFAEFAGGLVPNAAIAAAAAIRDNVNFVLRRFSSDVDGAYLGHRVLLEQPREAESYLFDLVGDEIKSILDEPSSVQKYVNDEAVDSYIRDRFADGSCLRINKERAPKPDGSYKQFDRVDIERAVGMVQAGIASMNNDFGSTNSAFERLYPLFYSSTEEGKGKFARFARLSAFRREVSDFPAHGEWQPMLTLGTMLRSDEKYFVCLQPVCDCVRKECNVYSGFFFGQLVPRSADSAFDLVLNDGRVDQFLRFDASPSKTRVLEFSPGGKSEVYAEESGKQFVFTDKSGTRFEWLGELRRLVAQRLVGRVSEQLARIGLDEFEWLRLQGRKK